MTSDKTIGERFFEMSIEIDAPLDVVWKALTEAEELTRWFPLEARVEPGAGGKIWLSWGGGVAGEAPIEIWDPRRQLRTFETPTKPWTGGPAGGQAPHRIVTDYLLESRGGKTVLRLVQSGFGRGGGWDDDYDSISIGWRFELRPLREYLERHRGQDRRVAWSSAGSGLGLPEAWARLTGSEGFCREGSIVGLREQDRYRVVTATGETYEGTVQVNDPPRSFVATVNGLGGALLRVQVERSGSNSGPFVWISLWGPEAARADEIQAGWKTVMGNLFGP